MACAVCAARRHDAIAAWLDAGSFFGTNNQNQYEIVNYFLFN
jgi:hypothetical protein